MKIAQAGTVESMDCRVTITESDGPVTVGIAGSGAARFAAAMEAEVREVLSGLGASQSDGLRVDVQDNGALGLVLGARVESAYLRFRGGAAS
jgi:citrate lyase subunit gamma (acyl carrier protein)